MQQNAHIIRGDHVRVSVFKADGTCYRWWQTMVETVSSELITTINKPGNPVYGPGGGWVTENLLRAYYWLHKRYNLLEIYDEDNNWREIYINITGQLTIEAQHISFIDYELDVVRFPEEPAKIVDVDEFAVAAGHYGYSEQLQADCFHHAREAVMLAKSWRVHAAP